MRRPLRLVMAGSSGETKGWGETASCQVSTTTQSLSRKIWLYSYKNLRPEQFYNADETGLYWKMLPNKTLAGRSETSAPGHKKMKERVSLLACANSTGTHRLPILLIGNHKNPGVSNM